MVGKRRTRETFAHESHLSLYSKLFHDPEQDPESHLSIIAKRLHICRPSKHDQPGAGANDEKEIQMLTKSVLPAIVFSRTTYPSPMTTISGPIQSGYALARLLAKLPSLNGTFASPKSVFVNAVRAAAVRLSQAISGCCPPRELVKPSLKKREF